MLHVIAAQLPWWLAGPGVGLCVVALYALANAKLGVSGGWLQLLLLAGGRVTEGWRIWFNGGLVGGAVLAAVLGVTVVKEALMLLGRAVGPVLLVPVLLAVGVAMGYGARWAGGCTSGHGISGCSAGSPESFAATATFFLVAIVVTAVVHLLSGGAV